MSTGYTAIVTPPMISFHWLDPPCSTVPTLPFDCLIDCFFLVDILMNFNTGLIVRGGEYIDDRMAVAKSYLKGMFLFDLVTSFPVSFFELAAEAACARADIGSAGVDGSQLRMIRGALRCVYVYVLIPVCMCACGYIMMHTSVRSHKRVRESSTGGMPHHIDYDMSLIQTAIKPLRWFKIARIMKLGKA